MKNKFLKFTCFLLAVSVLLTSCASTTLITSTPPGAKVYIDGIGFGSTPFPYSDKKIVSSTTEVKLEFSGYENLTSTIVRDEEINVPALIGGFFCVLPWLWALGYKPRHHYDLIPVNNKNILKNSGANNGKSKVEKLREFKQLLDEKIITQEEFDKEKEKILNQPE